MLVKQYNHPYFDGLYRLYRHKIAKGMVDPIALLTLDVRL